MSFYDWNKNFYGSGGPARPMRTDAMRDSRRDFRQLRNQGVLGQGSTLDARTGNMNLQDVNLQNGPGSAQENNQAIRGLRQDVNREGVPNYSMGSNGYTPQFGIDEVGMQQAKRDDLQAFKTRLNQRFQMPGMDNGLMPAAPSWMSSDRANDILSRISGKYNNALPYNANPYQESQARKKGGNPS